MSRTVLLVDEQPEASRALLEGEGCRVETARWHEAIGRANEVTPDAVVFVRPHREAVQVASTLGWVHDVPLFFIDAERSELASVRGARRVVATRERLAAIVRGALRT